MIRIVLPVVLLLAGSAWAETVRISDPEPSPPKEQAMPPCSNLPYSQGNCVRVLACIGQEGLWFDGQARGWDQGVVIGSTSARVPCAGHWKSGGFLGTGTSRMKCRDGTDVDVLYYSQDTETGTVIGRGKDSLGRIVRVWTGENVLKFLTPEGHLAAELPCGNAVIPIS